uniref:Uncharacterized protein n=1 Tax=Arundo donax TaxID=35708 RepID=A0A0A9C6Z1_ARUDO
MLLRILFPQCMTTWVGCVCLGGPTILSIG